MCGVVGGLGLCGGDGAKGDEHSWVNGNAVIQQGAKDLLDAGDFGWCERVACIRLGSKLYFGAIRRELPGMASIFRC